MICYLKGRILKKFEKIIFLENAGVGYKIKIPTKIIENLKENDELELFIHSHIREDAFDLYGFKEIKDLDLFELLLTVKGIGPKIALEILNSDSKKIKQAIADKDIAVVNSIPGIGKKSAERIILELKNKIIIDDFAETRIPGRNTESVSEDIIEALLKMGFQRAKIVNTLSSIPTEIVSEEEIITFFLKNA